MGKYPWIAAYKRWDREKGPGGCEGTLIASEWIVTAAHCVTVNHLYSAVTKDNFKIILGEHYLSEVTDGADTNR